MARVNIYLPDELANEAKEAGINISGEARIALENALKPHRTNVWLETLKQRPRLGVSHDVALEAVRAVKYELEKDEPFPGS